MACMSFVEILSGPEDLVITSSRDPGTINPTHQMCSSVRGNKKMWESWQWRELVGARSECGIL